MRPNLRPAEGTLAPDALLHSLVVDEWQSYDDWGSNETVTALLEECRQFRFRAVVANQDPRRLSRDWRGPYRRKRRPRRAPGPPSS